MMTSLEQLKNHYQESDSFGLYLGAGINLFPPEWKGIHKRCYETYAWGQLLEALYDKNKNTLTQSFEELLEIYKNDWPALASKIINGKETDEFIDQIDSIIYGCIPRSDRYGRLCKGILDQSPTLHAAICFASEINEETETSWTFKPNKKIKTLVTPNYDFFFGAGLTRYQNFSKHWKVHTPFSQHDANAQKVTINYIHGYVPYKLKRKEELVLTTEMYNKHYANNGFARLTTIEAIINHDLIFIGTSFTDEPLCRLLDEYKGKRDHYATVKAGTPEVEKARQLSICTIEVENFSQIARVLKEIYCSALDNETCKDVGLDNPDEYWRRLEEGPVKTGAKKRK